jgi:hypothetical protein
MAKALLALFLLFAMIPVALPETVALAHRVGESMATQSLC